jgi:signal transduction histidine kinase
MRFTSPLDSFTHVKKFLQRAWPLVRVYWFDVALVGLAVWSPLALVFKTDDGHVPRGSLWLLGPAIAVVPLLLLARRRWPFGAVAALYLYCAAVSFASDRLIVYPFPTFLTVLAGCFLFGLLADRRQSLIGLAIAIGAAAIVNHNNPIVHAGDYLFITIAFSIAWLAGFGLGIKFRQVEAAEERAARLEHEREERARLAVADERARIARELHDVVGHSVSVMTVQASAVRRLLQPEQEREREALLVVERTGREALAEMRRMVGVLRRPEEAPALAPQPSLEHLERLIEQARDAGLPVELEIEGEAVQLPAGVDLTAYRLVQEGLTNALKHAHAKHARVVVRYADSEVELTVSDDGRGGGAADGGGHGLVGMRERVSVYGGELEAGPRPEGGFQLRARLPVAAT